MRNACLAALTAILLSTVAQIAQTPAAKSVLGAVVSLNKETKVIEVKADNAAAITAKLLSSTVVQRVAPGQTNLTNAVTIQASEIAPGDRVLVTLASNGTD